MKRVYFLLILLPIITIIHTSCEKTDPRSPSDTDASIVSQFVYDGMSTYYLWADEVKKKKPTAADHDPEKYFFIVF